MASSEVDPRRIYDTSKLPKLVPSEGLVSAPSDAELDEREKLKKLAVELARREDDIAELAFLCGERIAEGGKSPAFYRFRAERGDDEIEIEGIYEDRQDTLMPLSFKFLKKTSVLARPSGIKSDIVICGDRLVVVDDNYWLIRGHYWVDGRGNHATVSSDRQVVITDENEAAGREGGMTGSSFHNAAKILNEVERRLGEVL